MEGDGSVFREIFFFIFSTFLILSNADKPPDTLRLVHTVFRHGDRSPVATYPNDPYNKNLSELWPKGLGQLSTTGIRQHHKLGQYFRQKYDGFLPKIYNNKNIVIRSTDVDRTLMSAQSHLSGLFPPEGADVWNPDIKWQPIPVHTVPQDEDHILTRDSVCPRYTDLYTELLESSFVQDIEKANEELFDYLEKNSGMKFVNITNTWKLFDILHIERLYNKTLPSWVTDKVFEKLRKFDALDFKLMAYNTQLKRLVGGGGSLVKEILNHWLQFINGSLSSDRKMFIYSAHDSTVATLLSSLGMMNNVAPPYAACVILELHEVKPQEFNIQISYKNNSHHEPYNMTVPGCSFSCPIKQFVEYTKDVIPDDIIKECELDVPSSEETVISEAVIYGLIASIGFLLILLQAVIIFIVKRRRNKRYSHLPETA